jgi:hypothetical protein
MVRFSTFLKAHTVVIASGAKQSLPLPINHSKIASSPMAPRNDLLLFRLKTLWRISIAVFTSLIIAPALALAHGGMGPEEIGPPIVTSGLLGFAGYWVVMLWPSAKKKDDQEAGVGEQNLYAPRTDSRSPKRSAHMKRRPRLRKIEGSGRFGSDQNTRRKASDG